VNDEKFAICYFASGDLESALKKRGLTVINNDALDTLAKKTNKDKKVIAKRYDYFVAQSDMMRNVAKVMARFLGQRNKMPKPQPKGFGVITSNENLEEFTKKLQRLVKLEMKKQLMVQVKCGRKSLTVQQLQENIESILTLVESKLPSGINNIKSIYIKTTMGPAIRVKEGSKK
jgi:large subunit ribosomal protein L1